MTLTLSPVRTRANDDFANPLDATDDGYFWDGKSSDAAFNVHSGEYGAKCDARVVTNAAISSHAVTAVGAGFASTDVGKTVILVGAGVTGGYNCLVTTISGWTDSNHVTVTLAATTNVTNARLIWGTDDTAAWVAANAALTAPTNPGGYLFMPASASITTVMPSWTPPTPGAPLPYGLKGEGSAITTIYHIGANLAASWDTSNPAHDAWSSPAVVSDGAVRNEGITLDGIGSSGGCSGVIWCDVNFAQFDDVDSKNFSTGDSWSIPNLYGWTERLWMKNCKGSYSAIQLHVGTGLGQQLGVLSSSITTGGTITSISIGGGGLTRAVKAGQKLVIYSGTGTLSETVVVASNAALGATSVSVNSYTTSASVTYTSGTAKLCIGAYPSMDYWRIELDINANANQHGYVSDVPMGQSQSINHDGSRWHVSGNFQTGSTNTGIMFWTKGDDFFDYQNEWHWSVEADGGTTAHKTFQLDSSRQNSFIGGTGTFTCALLLTGTYAGGEYQVEINGGGQNIAGITCATPGNSPIFMQGATMRNAYDPKPTFAPTVTNGGTFQNTLFKDIVLKVQLTFTAAGTVAKKTSSNSPIGSSGLTEAAVVGTKIVEVRMPGQSYARIDWTGTATVTATEVDGIY